MTNSPPPSPGPPTGASAREPAAEGRQRAIGAAVQIARDAGLTALAPVILKDSNNTLIHLAPHPIVAKVGTTNLPGRSDGLTHEIRVLEYLAHTQAPAVRPSTLIPAGPHHAGGLAVIFLELAETVADPATPIARAQALDAVHRALSHYPDALPGFLEPFATIAAELANEPTTPTLNEDDRAFLLNAHHQLLRDLPTDQDQYQALHGDPWVGNMLVTVNGPVLLDFEAACIGPLEWDWSPLSPKIAAHSNETLDPDLLGTLRLLRSLAVSTVLGSTGRTAEADEAARWHLQLLRQALG